MISRGKAISDILAKERQKHREELNTALERVGDPAGATSNPAAQVSESYWKQKYTELLASQAEGRSGVPTGATDSNQSLKHRIHDLENVEAELREQNERCDRELAEYQSELQEAILKMGNKGSSSRSGTSGINSMGAMRRTRAMMVTPQGPPIRGLDPKPRTDVGNPPGTLKGQKP